MCAIPAQELVPTAKRSIAALSVNVCHGLGYLILPLVAYFIRDWRWFLRFYTIACVCYFPILWIVTTLGFYTLGLNSSNLGGNIYLNCVYGALVDIMSYVTTALILSKKGRRSATSITIGIGGIMCLITPMLRRANVNVGIASAMIGKFFITSALSIIILYTGELFPTLLRNTTYGIASAAARIGSAISPFIIFAGETMNLSIPFYVTGCLSLLSAFMTIWLPETKATGLPNTVDEALELENYRTKVSVRKLSAPFRRKSEGTADAAA
ncbi:solute carrier family 22 member 21-like [Ciona intestinalis]